GGGRIINTRFFAMTAHYLFELVLESGITSAEHVLNVLARLNQSESPARVETSLKLDEEPQADTARYDHLNTLDAPYV
ncbi:MAG: IS21 family transposase, partial [Nitrosomonas sp.]|nr:IS21 family transposase [Nitrosomonas sp.]